VDVARFLFASVAAHAALWGALAATVRRPATSAPPRLPIAIEIAPAPAPTSEPSLAAPTADAPPRPGAPPGRGVGRPHAGATVGTTTRPPGPEPPPREAAPSGKWMGMRRATAPDVRAAVGLPEGPPPDGVLVFHDRTPLPIPGKGPGPLGPDAKHERGGGYRLERLTFDAHVRPDGTVDIEDKSPSTLLHGIGVSVTFDITDMIMRAIGDDPYKFEKLKLLDETREARAEMARADRRDRFHDALDRLPGKLGRIWGYDGWSDVERRRILFRLWDECAEKGDEELVHAAAQVRATIVAFIRRNLPAGGPTAYSDDELEALNAGRTSRARFDPYSEP